MLVIRNLIAFVFIILLINSCTSTEVQVPSAFKSAKISVDLPITQMDTTVKDDYHGTMVSDPYRWLEDENSTKTKNWVTIQNKTTNAYLQGIPYRKNIKKRLEELWNFERYSSPIQKNNKYYYFKNTGLQNQSVLYVQDDLTGKAEIVIDPNRFSDDGTASLGNYAFSKDGKFLAYQVSKGGSDWRTIYIKNLEDGSLMKDLVEWVKFSDISWYKDGFFYSRYPSPEGNEALSGKNEFHQVYYHQLNTPQSEDKLIFEDKKFPQRNHYTSTTEDERFLILNVVESTSGNALYFKDLNDKNAPFMPLITHFDNDFTVVDNIGEELLVLTNYKASNQRLIRIHYQKNQEADWAEIIPESEDVLQSINICGGKIVAKYIHNACSQVKFFDLNGTFENELKTPQTIANISNIQGDKKSDQLFYSLTTFTSPTAVYELNLKTLESTAFKKPTIKFDSDQYETKQVWYASYDGTKIPMTIIHKKGLKMDGQRPTLLYGYGGFNISILPRFQVQRLPILENEGIYAIANIRGGGEFGEKWHKSGTLSQKQNVFNDFQAAAEYLIKENYTSSEKLAIEGRSNGGLLVGACMTQRPDLYKVAFPAVGVLDMLRYHQFTIGWAWATDYGRSDDPEAYEYLKKYSPLHNVKAASYPATMVTTADHDDRVVPAHSFKFISELQKQHQGENPVLIRIDVSAGHGAGKSTSMQIEENTDLLSFMFYNLNENVYPLQ